MEQHGGSSSQKRHVVCIPYPAQGHINPMLKLAKLLHTKGFHVTFINTDYNHRRILRSRGSHALENLHSFHFEINNCLIPFKVLISRLNSGSDVPPVSYIVSDSAMSFTLDAADELKIPVIFLWTNSATALILYLHYQNLTEKIRVT